MDRPEDAALTGSLPQLRRDLLDIVAAGVAGARPGILMGRCLSTAARDVRSDPRPYTVVAAGKAAAGMLAGLLEGLDAPCANALLVVPAAMADAARGSADVVAGGHPLPDAGSAAAADRALASARGLGRGDRLIVLLSGGASALLAAPVPPITLADKVALTGLLLAAGASIGELNAVRKHVSAIKGGRLAAATEASVTTFALSDVVAPVEDDPSVIGSGPTVPDPSTFADALAAIDRHGLRSRVAPAVLAHLARGMRGAEAETPKRPDPGREPRAWHLIGSRRTAMAAAETAARRLGYAPAVLDEAITGAARDAGPALLSGALARTAGARGPWCVIASGETTVHVTGTGRGGRNQELVLSTVAALAACDRAVVVASVGTDGIDGPTDAAGAVADPTTLRRATAAGARDPAACLADNDAYAFLAAADDVIRTGPTGTNVADLQVVLIG